MGARNTTGVLYTESAFVASSYVVGLAYHSEHDSQTPAPCDGLVVAFLACAENDLGNDTITEHDQDECAKELREGFTELVSYSAPYQVWLCLNSILLRTVVVDGRTMLSMRYWLLHLHGVG